MFVATIFKDLLMLIIFVTTINVVTGQIVHVATVVYPVSLLCCFLSSDQIFGFFTEDLRN
jgi:hypothetical protein